MFESAELGHTIDDKTFKVRATQLRAALLDAQYKLLENSKFPVVILVNGVDGAGKGETVNLLNKWMDPRHVQTVAAAVTPALANALLMATGKPLTTVPLTLPGEVTQKWDVPAGLNTFDGATDWSPPAGWMPISAR